MLRCLRSRKTPYRTGSRINGRRTAEARCRTLAADGLTSGFGGRVPLQQAKELSRGSTNTGRKPKRVALLCYSIGLASYLKRQVATWRRNHRPAFVGTFHEFGKHGVRPTGTAPTATSGRSTCPES